MSEESFPVQQAREYYNKGLFAFEKKNYDYAIELFFQALNLKKDFADARHYLRLSEQGKFQENPPAAPVLLFGTSDFAVPAINELSLSKHKILAVVTAVDKRKGRGKVLSFSPVKLFAQKKGLALLQPANLQDAKFIQFLKNKPADLFVVCAYGRLLTKEILQIPVEYAINLHASLLPKYRGAAPVNWAIIRGETRTGTTAFKMNEYMDKGEIILQEKADIFPSDTAVSLTEKLSKAAAQLLVRAIDLIGRGLATFTAQDESRASPAPKLKKEDGLVNWEAQASEIHNRIRGLQPWPGAFSYFENKLLKIWGSQIVQGAKGAEAGEIVDVDKKRGILVQTGRDKLLITALQLEGKKRMSAAEFILGHPIEAGRRLGKLK